MQSLREHRIARGISIESTIRSLGISRPTYMKYEKDPRTMPMGTYLQLCDFLDVDPGDVFLPSSVKETKRKEAKDGEGAPVNR